MPTLLPELTFQGLVPFEVLVSAFLDELVSLLQVSKGRNGLDFAQPFNINLKLQGKARPYWYRFDLENYGSSLA